MVPLYVRAQSRFGRGPRGRGKGRGKDEKWDWAQVATKHQYRGEISSCMRAELKSGDRSVFDRKESDVLTAPAHIML